MESPVRICLGAAIVVSLLLLGSTIVDGSAIHETTSTAPVKEEISSKYTKTNGTTWVTRGKPKTLDVALNELNPKESVSEEHTDKNAKYKDRGRVKFGAQYSSTAAPRRRVIRTSTDAPKDAPKLMIVTPEPEKKNLSQILEGMRVYKKTKMPISSSSTTPIVVVKKEVSSQEEEFETESEEEERENFDRYTSSKFHENKNFFTIPGYNEDEDFSHDSAKDGTENKVHKDFNIPSYDKFSTYFPKETSYSSKDDDGPYQSESFFHNFEIDLTTPKNDFFDKKFKQISSSIIKKLDSIKTKSPPSNKTNVHKILKENVDISKLNNGTPDNKSTVIMKNTKEVHLLDSEKAGSTNQELSDVHGTSIYYEMSVLSTETYNFEQSDDDCDNDTLPEPTPSTTNEQELSTIKGSVPTLLESNPTISGKTELISTSSSSISPISSSANTFLSTSLNTVLSTEESTASTKLYSSNFSRNRTYKRLNFTRTKEPNKISPNNDQVGSNQVYRPITRRFHYTTPKSKPTWMAPKRNITRIYQRPTTIYSEHFDISDKFTTTPKPKQPTRTALTTVSSEIDPVLQKEIGGADKVVHSQSISDNSIPTLWKRGSTKFGSSSTVSSTEAEESGTSDLEIPPTLTAWALASLRSPPSLASPVVNRSLTTQKSDDENELQNVGEVADKTKTTTTSTSLAPTTTVITNELTSKGISEMDQNKLAWKPLYTPSSTSSEAQTESTAAEAKSERQPAESNISVQSSAGSVPTVPVHTFPPFNPDISAADLIGLTKNPPPWVDVQNETTEEVNNNDNIPPTKFTKGFESITKLPSGLTTPNSDDILPITINKEEVSPETNTAIPSTTDYEITTIRFSYVPTVTEETTETTESIDTDKITTDVWHPVVPTRTTLRDSPVTTYRPQYKTTTDNVEETTTYVPDSTSVDLELSSKAAEITDKPETVELQTVTFTEPITEINNLSEETTQKQEEMTEETEKTTQKQEETSTVIVEVHTEINSERESDVGTFTTNIPESTETMTESPPNKIESDVASEENSGSNEVITQETKPTSTSTTTTTTTSTIETTSKLEPPTEPIKIETTQTVFTTSSQPEVAIETTTIQQETKTIDATTDKEESIIESTTDFMSTKSVNELEDLTTYNEELTTEASSRVLTTEEAGSGAAIAIAVSTIGVIALILLVGLLLVVRRRGRRGIYAQRCTPVSLDAYSLDSVSVGHRKGNHRLRASKRSYGNPAYDDEVTSHPMQYAALANFALDTELMTSEFAEIPSVTVRPDEVPPGCEDKNRYSNVLPLPDTRVPLQRIGSDPTTEYINANYVSGPGNIKNYYIACQAPLHNTVADLWRMIWEQNSRLIVMLTEYMENGVEKCYEYLPPSEISDNKRTFGDYQVVLKKREQRDKYAISTVQLINLRTRTWREVTHMWYFWPAKGVPDDYDSVIDFLSEMRGFMKISQTAKEFDEEGVEVIYGDQSRSSFHNLSRLRSEDSGSGNGVNVYSPAKAEEQLRRNTTTNGTLSRMKVASEAEGVRPCVVICASGAGRSAAVIALDVCARALAAGVVDVPRVVRELRAQRPHSLANRHHYIFVYKVLSEYGNKLMGGGVDSI